MDPAESDEVIFILDSKEFFLVVRGARIRIPFLFGYHQMCDVKLVVFL